MKKFASLLLSGAMVAAMAFTGAVSVSATEPITPTQTTGSITLTKQENDTKDGIENATFSAYRVLDFDGSVYTLNDSFKDSEVTVDSLVGTSNGTTGYVSFGTTSELEAQISKIQQFTRDSKVDPTTTAKTDANGSATLADLPLGVYLVAETNVPDGYIITTQSFLVSVPQWDNENSKWVYDIEAKPKNKDMSVDKTVTSSAGKDSDVYNVGDVMEYNISADVPDYGMSTDYPTVQVTDNMAANDAKGPTEGVKKFNLLNLTFTDTMSKGLTLQEDSITVKVDGEKLSVADSVDEIRSLASAAFDKEAETVTLTETDTSLKDCAVIITNNADGTTTLQVVISWMAVNKLQDKDIDIDYKAQLNADAVVTDANTNDVTYNFTNDPTRVTGNADDPTKGETTDENKIYTYQADVSKLFNGKSATDAKVDASSVTFELQNPSTDEVWNLVKLDNGSYSIWTGTVKDGKALDANGSEVGEVVTSMNPTESGSLTIKGFNENIYQLVETASADGYSLITSPIVITLKKDYDETTNEITGKVTATVKNADGTAKELVHPDPVETVVDGTTTTTYYLGEFKLDINNTKSQFNLPTTGGLGLWMFTIAGGVIMAGAIIFIAVLRKKRSA